MSALVRYARPTTLSSWIDDLFNDSVFNSVDRNITNTTWPKVDIAEDKDSYMIHADLPGMDKKDIAITVENGVLTIKGEKKDERKSHEKDRFYHYERSYGSFARSFYLPDNADGSRVEASYNNGVIELTLAKKEESKPMAIDIKVK